MNAITSSEDNHKYPCFYLERYFQGWNKGEITIHQAHCLVCAEWLYNNHRERFEHVFNKAKVNKRRGKLRILDFAEKKGYQTKNSKRDSNTINSFLDDIVRSCRAYKLREELSDLPDIPGVYILTINAQQEIKVIYIGKSEKSLRHRWLQHHRWSEIQVLLNAGVEVNMYCLLFPAEGSESVIDRTEKDLIAKLDPAFNNKPVVDLSDSKFV